MTSLRRSDPHVIRKTTVRQLTFDGAFAESDDAERWLPIPFWPDYDVSNIGRVRSWRGHGFNKRRASVPLIRKPCKAGKGYLVVSPGRKFKPEYVHRLVMFIFVGPCPEGHECRHLDGDRTNNRLTNLEWGTPEQNGEDKVLHGTMKPYRKDVPEGPTECNDNFIPIEAIIPAEIWKTVAGFPKYDVSNWGRLRSRHSSTLKPFGVRHALHSPHVDKNGYSRVILRENGVKRSASIHRLVIGTFSPQDDTSLECRHLNGDPTDNHLANLRWGTHAENMADMSLHGRSNKGSRCPTAKLNEDQVLEIKERIAAGERQCRIAKEFGVSQATICDIKKRRRWDHVG
jgi:hypothetical protein